jgi:hypothetical protein
LKLSEQLRRQSAVQGVEAVRGGSELLRVATLGAAHVAAFDLRDGAARVLVVLGSLSCALLSQCATDEADPSRP